MRVSRATIAAAMPAAKRSNWLMNTPPMSKRRVVDAEIEAVDLGAPHQLGRALDDVGEAEASP